FELKSEPESLTFVIPSKPALSSRAKRGILVPACTMTLPRHEQTPRSLASIGMTISQQSGRQFGNATSRAELAELFGELHDLTLRPAPIIGRIAVTLADKGAMPTVIGLDENNVAIREQRLPRFRQNSHERIVGRVNHQRGLRDAADHVRS